MSLMINNSLNTGSERVFQGIPVSPGIAIGRCFVMTSFGQGVAEPRHLDQGDVENEIKRFMHAIELSKDQLYKIRQQVANAIDEKHADIFVAQAEFLTDPELIDYTVNAIREEGKNVEYIFSRRVRTFMDVLAQLEDESFQARNSDLLDVSKRVLSNLGTVSSFNFENLRQNTILVGQDLSPSEISILIKKKIGGMVLEKGGATSHTAILAKALEIPSVVGVSEILNIVQHWDTVIIDGQRGRIIINPSAKTYDQYEREKSLFAVWEKEVQELRELPAETVDGYGIKLRANVELEEEVELTKKHGSHGIGLFRTEFLFMNRDESPSEEEQYEIYKNVVEKIAPKPTVFRTLDFGGDKFLKGNLHSRELNPFMGLRAIRLCLAAPEIFRAQIRALLRAGVHGPIRILIPMISGLDEMLEVKKHIRRAKAELKLEGIPFDNKAHVGAMIEIPSAAVCAQDLAEECDFLSIGTNDLIQYTLAVDRGNEKVAYLYEALHPAVLRLIKQTVLATRKAGIPLSVCGEMAADPMYAMVLLGMGIDEFSMSAVNIPYVKKLIRSIELAEARSLADEVLAQNTITGIHKVVKKRAKAYAHITRGTK